MLDLSDTLPPPDPLRCQTQSGNRGLKRPKGGYALSGFVAVVSVFAAPPATIRRTRPGAMIRSTAKIP